MALEEHTGRQRLNSNYYEFRERNIFHPRIEKIDTNDFSDAPAGKYRIAIAEVGKYTDP